MSEGIMNSAGGDKPEREHYDDRGEEANNDITFSAPTFIFLKFFMCLSGSSDVGLDPFSVPSCLEWLPAISAAD